MAKAKVTKTKIAAAAMTAGGGATGGAVIERLDPRTIESAMGQAVEKALKDGITDPKEILKLKMAARERVRNEHRDRERKALSDFEAKTRAK